MDEIRLTLPREPGYYPVAHLVVGGIGSRLELTLDGLDDLRLALDNLLERARGGEVRIVVRVEDGTLVTEVGPFDGELRGELADDRAPELGLRRILHTLMDGVTLNQADHEVWVTLEKRIPG